VGGRYRLPWEDQIVHVDGTSCGFAPPERVYGGPSTRGAPVATPRRTIVIPTTVGDEAIRPA